MQARKDNSFLQVLCRSLMLGLAKAQEASSWTMWDAAAQSSSSSTAVTMELATTTVYTQRMPGSAVSTTPSVRPIAACVAVVAKLQCFHEHFATELVCSLHR